MRTHRAAVDAARARSWKTRSVRSTGGEFPLLGAKTPMEPGRRASRGQRPAMHLLLRPGMPHAPLTIRPTVLARKHDHHGRRGAGRRRGRPDGPVKMDWCSAYDERQHAAAGVSAHVGAGGWNGCQRTSHCRGGPALVPTLRPTVDSADRRRRSRRDLRSQPAPDTTEISEARAGWCK